MTVAAPLSHVPVAELRDVWPKIRDHVSWISERTSQPWIAEDVYHEILVGNAYLWMTPDRESFVVLQVQVAPYTRDLHVWLASNQAEANAAAYWPQLLAIGREALCNRVEFESPRRWERAVPGLTVRHLYSQAT
ncbi:hypothetical protein D3Y57_07075 [Sphingomonas paeninsulae]|uniref:Uncharacterized protein n=1 Tax=Sphingomonas paeninsulae TaxID=2319844 RepID=A0A494T9X4_SPHPE|nr:hypothetical protein [Sphingomonas paeninsulae]AYJ85780.1 hypothetical protein D3Y57_07075 [Sphingomonas paeninsulae]